MGWRDGIPSPEPQLGPKLPPAMLREIVLAHTREMDLEQDRIATRIYAGRMTPRERADEAERQYRAR